MSPWVKAWDQTWIKHWVKAWDQTWIKSWVKTWDLNPVVGPLPLGEVEVEEGVVDPLAEVEEEVVSHHGHHLQMIQMPCRTKKMSSLDSEV